MGLNEVAHFAQVTQYAKENQIKPSDICIVGSAVLAFYGIRTNNDIEIIIDPNAQYNLIPKKKIWAQYHINNTLDLFKNIYSFCGISDQTVFEEGLFSCVDGYKIASIELEYLYKIELSKILKRSKDINDLEKMEIAFPDIGELSFNIHKKYGRIATGLLSKSYYKYYLFSNYIRSKVPYASRKKNE